MDRIPGEDKSLLCKSCETRFEDLRRSKDDPWSALDVFSYCVACRPEVARIAVFILEQMGLDSARFFALLAERAETGRSIEDLLIRECEHVPQPS